MDAPTLYAAYGSNLDHARMRHASRCPGAEPLGAALLPGWRLVVNRYASILRDEDAFVPLGLWRVTPRHLRALDVAEGTALGIYRRIRIRLPQPVGGAAEAWTYVEQVHRAGPPAAWYVAHLRQGYRDFGLEPSALDSALSAAAPR
ncbi:gamma-glutamylcyclotransferase [Falsiroseomonas bella]|uniref:Gamma-glutamylcyclotransferase n=1 Tax=Falsiroseomonas bella TaxID=2184016 RepID=A0A317FHV8_9PROT|nr:gamma-glutamylcyclotransferase family protein [Falsiroseomonas bella]PWS37519.1 gamma-glutamylcyclotransferase [Falsiroseomonas bella]